MDQTRGFCNGICITVAIAAFTWACATCAEPGDNEAIAKARHDYEQAKRSNDLGLMNAMKITLDVQLAKARARAVKKEEANGNADVEHKKASPKS